MSYRRINVGTYTPEHVNVMSLNWQLCAFISSALTESRWPHEPTAMSVYYICTDFYVLVLLFDNFRQAFVLHLYSIFREDAYTPRYPDAWLVWNTLHTYRCIYLKTCAGASSGRIECTFMPIDAYILVFPEMWLSAEENIWSTMSRYHLTSCKW